MAGKEWLDFFSRAARNRFFGGSRKARCAVLVDGDNVPPRLTGALVHYASSLGRVTSIEVFANFASSHAAGWSAQMKEHGVIGFQHYRTSNGKNAANISLIVRAMDILHTERPNPNHYVIVSNDSDFSALAHRIRRSGETVHGVGHTSAAASLRASCTTFLTFDELSSLILSTDAATGPHAWKHPPSDAEDRVLNALIRLGAARQWVDISKLGQELREASPTFDPRSYGCRTLGDLCDVIDSVEVDREEASPRVRIALRIRNGALRAEDEVLENWGVETMGIEPVSTSIGRSILLPGRASGRRCVNLGWVDANVACQLIQAERLNGITPTATQRSKTTAWARTFTRHVNLARHRVQAD